MLQQDNLVNRKPIKIQYYDIGSDTIFKIETEQYSTNYPPISILSIYFFIFQVKLGNNETKFFEYALLSLDFSYSICKHFVAYGPSAI